VDELSPRDVVSRAMTRRMLEQGADHLWLDATGLEAFAVRFPTIAAALDGVGLDPGADWLPIAPAAHYLCGGILTDLNGATTLPGLWAAGEVACAGIHGANRLASNSLLDGMVFGARVIEAVAAGRRGPSPTGAMEAVAGLVGGPRPPSPPPGYATTGGGIAAERLVVDLPAVGGGDGDPAEVRADLQQVMTREAGVVRTGGSLAAAAGVVESLAARSPDPRSGADAAEAANLVTVASALVAAAAARAESRGAHTRDDFPETAPRLRRRLVVC
jgi:L-aspartate oxidase